MPQRVTPDCSGVGEKVKLTVPFSCAVATAIIRGGAVRSAQSTRVTCSLGIHPDPLMVTVPVSGTVTSAVCSTGSAVTSTGVASLAAARPDPDGGVAVTVIKVAGGTVLGTVILAVALPFAPIVTVVGLIDTPAALAEIVSTVPIGYPVTVAVKDPVCGTASVLVTTPGSAMVTWV